MFSLTSSCPSNVNFYVYIQWSVCVWVCEKSLFFSFVTCRVFSEKNHTFIILIPVVLNQCWIFFSFFWKNKETLPSVKKKKTEKMFVKKYDIYRSYQVYWSLLYDDITFSSVFFFARVEKKKKKRILRSCSIDPVGSKFCVRDERLVLPPGGYFDLADNCEILFREKERKKKRVYWLVSNFPWRRPPDRRWSLQ